MKPPKKKKSKEELEIESESLASAEDDGRPVPFEALAELTSSDVIAQVKQGMSAIEPIDLDDEFNEDIA